MHKFRRFEHGTLVTRLLGYTRSYPLSQGEGWVGEITGFWIEKSMCRGSSLTSRLKLRVRDQDPAPTPAMGAGDNITSAVLVAALKSGISSRT